MDPAAITVVQDIAAATEQSWAVLTRAGDVILFENDLPDHLQPRTRPSPSPA